jgi:beta-glucosidase
MPLDIPALLASLTLAEKAALTSGSDFWHSEGIERLGIPGVMLTDGPHGLRKQAGDTEELGLHDSVPATCFPTAATLASTWDPDLLRRVGEALGAQARAERVAVLLGPGVNIKRSPLCGRNFEYFSEDPLLAGVLAAALVQGIQSQGVGASLKHFAVNNQETDRMRISVDVDERTLREIYLPAFEHVVRTAQPWTVMCAYNRVNGVYASQHRELLTGILRDEWGFDGVVVSDWGAVDERVPALLAGLDLEMPASGGATDAELVAAVEAGTLDEAVLDVAVTRMLTLLDRTWSAHAGEPEGPAGYDAAAHHALAREAAAAGAVLLVNDGLLPLRPAPGDALAVIGEFARTPRYQGAGSSLVNPTRLDDALTALRAGVPEGVDVRFAPGFRLDGAPEAAGAGTDDGQLLAEAVDAARAASAVLLFLGLPPAEETEGLDRTRLDLPAGQLRLLDAVAAVNPRVAVVLSNGAVVTTGWSGSAGVSAVLECWLGGQAGGSAVADVVLGRVNPSGRLAETVPLRLEDTPAFGNWPGEEGQVRYGEGVLVGYRYYDTCRREVAFPFGHGLSYTTFRYADLAVEPLGQPLGQPGVPGGDGGGLRVTVTVTNTGGVAGREVVQVYLQPAGAGGPRPRALAGFAAVTLAPGESRKVVVDVERRRLAYWSVRSHAWVVEGGVCQVAVGSSSRDLRAVTEIEVAGDGVRPPLTETSTLVEWLADPVGGPLLREAFQVGEHDPLPGPLGDPEMFAILGSVPLRKLVGFGMGVDRTQLDGLLQRV